MGGMTAPVVRSGACPAWMASVAKPGRTREAPPPCGPRGGCEPSATAAAGLGELARPPIHGARLLRHALAVVDDAEVVVGAVVVRAGSHGTLERFGRGVQTVELVEAHAEMVLGPPQPGFQIHRALELLDSGGVETPLRQHDPQLGPRRGILRFEP